MSKKYGKLSIIGTANSLIDNRGYDIKMVKCLCDCGNIVIVRELSVKNGNTKSCKCIRNKHNDFNTYEYRCWANIKQRCKNKKHPDYLHYGGRGIDYDPRYDVYINFKNDLIETIGLRTDKKLSIDRIDNNKGYWKFNLKWSTKSEQQFNRRR
jgi:hypothetical protein